MNTALSDLVGDYDRVEALYHKKNYIFGKGHLNVNLFGVRAATVEPDNFDDLLCMAYTVDGKNTLLKSPGTTDPGTYYLENPMNPKGTAIILPGQYPGVFALGQYRGQNAFVQRGNFTVIRDANRNNVLDSDGPCETGVFGIHMHGKRGTVTDHVGRWSAGCQVVRDDSDLELYYHIAWLGAPTYGDRVTYTLFTEDDFRKM